MRGSSLWWMACNDFTVRMLSPRLLGWTSSTRFPRSPHLQKRFPGKRKRFGLQPQGEAFTRFRRPQGKAKRQRDQTLFGVQPIVLAQQLPLRLLAVPVHAAVVIAAAAPLIGVLPSVDHRRGMEGKLQGVLRRHPPALLLGEKLLPVILRGQAPLLHKGAHILRLYLAAEIYNQRFGGGIHSRHQPMEARPVKLPLEGQLDTRAFPAAGGPEFPWLVTYHSSGEGGRFEGPDGSRRARSPSRKVHGNLLLFPILHLPEGLVNTEKRPGQTPGA